MNRTIVSPCNDNEMQSLDTLYVMREKKERIELTLNPRGSRVITKAPENELLINEGRGGKFTEISEDFYDYLVDKFDSRYAKQN